MLHLPRSLIVYILHDTSNTQLRFSLKAGAKLRLGQGTAALSHVGWYTGFLWLANAYQVLRFSMLGLMAEKGLFGVDDAPSPDIIFDAGWSSPVAREAHNLEVVGSNPAPATSLFASSRRGNSVKLTAVGYSIKPVFCSNAKHRLFSYFPAIFWLSTTLQRLDSRSQLSPNQPLSEGQSETNTLRVSGLCCVAFKLTLAAGLTTLGYESSDSLGILFFRCSASLRGP